MHSNCGHLRVKILKKNRVFLFFLSVLPAFFSSLLLSLCRTPDKVANAWDHKRYAKDQTTNQQTDGPTEWLIELRARD